MPFFSLFLSWLCFATLLLAAPPKEMNLHDMMEDYTRPADKHRKKTGDSEPLVLILKDVHSFAPDAWKEDWKKIVETKLAEGKPEDTCKACHSSYKKDYKNQYRKKLLKVPETWNEIKIFAK